MKAKIIILFLSIITFNVFSQNVEINISKECLNENNFKIIKGKVPYLIIKMKNTTDKDIYFKNPFLSVKNELPNFIPVTIHSFPVRDRMTKGSKLKGTYKHKSFYLKIGDVLGFNSLEVFEDKFFKRKEEGDGEYWSSFINDDLLYIYESIRLQKILNKKSINQKLSLFSDKTKEHISLNEVKNKLSFTEFYGVSKELVLKDKNNINIKSNKDIFYFLKKGETIDLKVNLIGFKLLGGVYNLSLGFDKFEDFIEYRNKKITLPSNYNNYHLYQGKIKFNNLKVSF